MGNKTVQLWEEKTWDFHKLRQRGADTLLFTDPASTDDRLTQQGRFTIVAADDIAQGSSYGLISMQYVCHFFITQIDNNPPLIGVGYQAEGNAAFTAANPFGPSVTVEAGSNISVEYTVNVSNSIFTLPGGTSTHKFFVVLHWIGTGLGTCTKATTAPDVITNIFDDTVAATDRVVGFYLEYGGTNITHQIHIQLSAITTITDAHIRIFPVPVDFTARRPKFIMKDEIKEMKEQMKLLQYKLGIDLDPASATNQEIEGEQDFQNLPLLARDAAKQLLAMKRTQSPTRK
jgi:hypothetical protein